MMGARAAHRGASRDSTARGRVGLGMHSSRGGKQSTTRGEQLRVEQYQPGPTRLGAKEVAVGALLDAARGQGVTHVACEVLRDGRFSIAAECMNHPSVLDNNQIVQFTSARRGKEGSGEA